MKRGLYRIPGVGDLPNDVRVDDDGIEVPLDEQLYRARGYQPPVETLPWQDQYGKPQPSAESRRSTREAADKASREHARQEFLDRFRKG
ncbi:MAG TPA: hypothetical protein VE993_02215 [Stellaceae bacterium]|nr:hypothetical protein [Stellaceae bacterium]